MQFDDMPSGQLLHNRSARRSVGKENMYQISQGDHARSASRLRLDVRENCLDEATKERHMAYFFASLEKIERARRICIR